MAGGHAGRSACLAQGHKRPKLPPSLLVELALHHAEHLGQPCIAGILCAEDQGQARSISLGAAKAVTPAVEADPSPIRSLDEADRIHGAQVQPVGDVLTLTHKGVDALPGPERPAKRPAKAITRRRAITASDVFTFASLGRSDGVALDHARRHSAGRRNVLMSRADVARNRPPEIAILSRRSPPFETRYRKVRHNESPQDP